MYAGEMDLLEETDLGYCQYRCLIHLQCESVNFNHRSNQCILVSMPFDEDELDEDEEDDEWFNYGTPHKGNFWFILKCLIYM